MDDKGRGFSLRKQKAPRRLAYKAKQISSPVPSPLPTPALSAPTSQPPPRVNGTVEKHLALPQDGRRERPKLGGNTSDLVKRRYSTRFTQPPDSTNSEHVPAVPGVPKQYVQQPGLLSPLPSQKLSADLTALKDPNLQAERYATHVLSDASDQEIRDFEASLHKIKDRASVDLQLNVYQNRTQFIKISKEAEKLKKEMRTLRGLMSDLTTTLGQASMSSSLLPELRTPAYENGATRARKQANRSSVAIQENLWMTHLQSLWKSVEGSQKFLPAIPGRHIILESSNWLELDAATWKAKRRVHLFLLNDHLMVAIKKRTRLDPNALTNSPGSQKVPDKRVAERCWPVQDIDVVDLALADTTSSKANGASDRSEMADAISIRYGQQSFTYRCDRSSPGEKANLLLAFRRAVDELRKSQQVDAQENSNKGKEIGDYLATRDPAISEETDLLRSMSIAKDRPELLIDVDGKQKNLRWLEGQIDELDIEVALQRFEDAVKNVERLRKLANGIKGNLVAQDLITTKLDERASKLADLIVKRLIETHSFLHATQTNISYLVRLGFDDRARETYLQARSTIIAKRARQCVFEGDLHQYIFQISYVYFTLMRNTVNIYQQCFPPLMMSACVKWAKDHLDGFNVILTRQLSSVQVGSPVWRECRDRAKEHAGIMHEVGLEFRSLVGVGLGDITDDVSSGAAGRTLVTNTAEAPS